MEDTNDKDDTLIARWISGELTKEEASKLKADPDVATFKKIIDASENLYFEKSNLDEQYKTLLSKRDEVITRTKKTTYIKWFFTAAAIVIIFGISYLFFPDNLQNVRTEIAQTKEITLPDNSTITLNASSSISYNSDNFLKNRILILEGEAYFKVQKGSSFTIQTDNGTITVLGTAFNVFSRESDFTVFCDEGRVQVQRDSTSLILNANEGAFAKAELPLTSTLSKRSPKWRTGRTYFQKESLKEVYKELERQFPVSLNTEKIDVNRLYSGYFDHSNLEKALEEISKPMRIHYKIIGSKVELSPVAEE